MTRQDYVKVCNTCKNKSFDRQQGVICNLTKNIASFSNVCEDYLEIEKAVKVNYEKKSYVDEEQLAVNRKGAVKNMIFGALWCVGGIVGTVANVGYVFWGAIIFGGFQFIKGAIELQE